MRNDPMTSNEALGRLQEILRLVLQDDEIDDGQWIDPALMDRRVAAQDPVLTEAISLIWKRYRELIVLAG